MRLSFGKHKGKTIQEIFEEGEYGYIVWLSENVGSVNVDRNIYQCCKDEVIAEKLLRESIIESDHSDWGCRD